MSLVHAAFIFQSNGTRVYLEADKDPPSQGSLSSCLMRTSVQMAEFTLLQINRNNGAIAPSVSIELNLPSVSTPFPQCFLYSRLLLSNYLSFIYHSFVSSTSDKADTGWHVKKKLALSNSLHLSNWMGLCQQAKKHKTVHLCPSSHCRMQISECKLLMESFKKRIYAPSWLQWLGGYATRSYLWNLLHLC